MELKIEKWRYICKFKKLKNEKLKRKRILEEKLKNGKNKKMGDEKNENLKY